MKSRRRFLQQSLATTLGIFPVVRAGFASADDAKPRAQAVHVDIKDASGRAELALQFRGKTAEEARKWQKIFRSKLAGLLGNFQPPAKWNVEEESRRTFDDHVRHDLVLHAEGIPSVPVYLLIPTGVSQRKPAPGVLCVHGHGKYGHHPVAGRTDIEGVSEAIAGAHYDYGLQFVRRGYVVAAPCMIPFGRRVEGDRYGRSDPCAITFVRMQALGQLPMAANLRDLRWCIDLLQSRPEVRKPQIGCAGLSYGGRMTMLVSAMDERIKAAAVSGALNLLQERITVRYSCGSQIIPGLLQYGDYSEIGSLIAPRPCVWEVGAKDTLIDPQWGTLFRNRLRRIYKATRAGKSLRFDDYDGGHRWNGKIAYPLFDSVLKT